MTHPIALRLAPAALAVLALAGCGRGEKAGTQEADVQAAAVPAVDTGPSLASAPAVFGQCAACHSLQPGRHGIGPSLFRVYGTKAGDIPGYNFSAVLKASDLIWDDATLDKWLAAPMQTVPGTKMTYGGLKDGAKRAELIAFLKTLK